MWVGKFFMCSRKKMEERRVLWEGLKNSRQGMLVKLDIGM